jgi:AcrR family transcriptional regulator
MTFTDQASDDQTTRTRIVRTAEHLLHSKRNADFTLNEIAEKLGLHYTAVYHYFKSSDDIKAYLIEAYSADRSLQLASARSSGGNAFDQLMEYVRQAMQAPSNSLIIRGRATLNEPFRQRAIKAQQATRLELAQLIEKGVTDRSVIAIDPHLAAHLIVRILDRFADQDGSVFSEAGLSTEQLTTELLAFFKTGISAKGKKRSALLTEAPKTLFNLQDTTLDRILRAAIENFNIRGMRKTSIPEVASTLHISKTSFYRYAASKEELLYLCAHRTLNILTQIRQAAIAATDSPLQAILTDTVLIRRLTDSEPGPLLTPYLFDSLTEAHGRTAWDMYHGYRKVQISLLREAIDEGQTRPLIAEAVQPIITACSYIRFQDKDTTPKHRDQVMQVISNGLSR